MISATRIHFLIAALFGAGGVALLAAGSHVAGTLLTTSGTMLLFHAPAIMAATLARKGGHLNNRIAQTAIAVMIVGVALFAGDLCSREFAGSRLFPMGAPIGGASTIAGWALLALAALVNQSGEKG